MILDTINVPSMIPNIGPGPVGPPIPHPLQRTVDVEERSMEAFEHFLQAAMDVVNETNHLMIESDVAQVRFATGQDNDMLAVILAQERASSALSFTVQVSNRIIEAYREIMRMQV